MTGTLCSSLMNSPCSGKWKGMGKKIVFYVAKDYYINGAVGQAGTQGTLHMCEKLWNVACDIMQKADRVCLLSIYYPWELHFPLLCGYMHNPPVIKLIFSDVGVERMPGTLAHSLKTAKSMQTHSSVITKRCLVHIQHMCSWLPLTACI